jgi:hypothetical protein
VGFANNRAGDYYTVRHSLPILRVWAVLNYNYEHHRFLPFVVEEGYITDTMWLGLGFLCSVILYLSLVRKMRPHSK